MPREHIDFRSLLERVLPLDSLPPAERAHVQQALASGVASQIEQAALLALAELERHGALTRLPGEETPGTVRYQSRDRLEVITLRLPEAHSRGGVQYVPRMALPAQAQTALVHVRRLLRLDEPLYSTDPRTVDPRIELFGQLDVIGRELLGAREVRFVPANGGAADAASVGEPWMSEALGHAETLLYCPDAGSSEAVRMMPLRAGLRAWALVAVATPGERPFGVLEVRASEPRPFDPSALALVALIADCCATALARASRIERLVFIDPLTSAYNRPYFDLQMTNEIARSEREHASMAVLIADIDDFKQVNSSYGYEAGNQVLVQVAKALRGGVRPFDTLCRWGGEEFAVLLTEPVQLADVKMIAERLRTAVERQTVRVEALDARVHSLRVTASIGVAMYPQHGASVQDLWRAANHALLRAKQPPKNQVVFYSNE